jgi:hypothetical protein
MAPDLTKNANGPSAVRWNRLAMSRAGDGLVRQIKRLAVQLADGLLIGTTSLGRGSLVVSGFNRLFDRYWWFVFVSMFTSGVRVRERG